jgi:outer membrane biogenesis lipoprotein LolB
MKRLLSLLALTLLTACATSAKNESISSFDADFKTVFNASMSALKDRKFTIKNFDWNSGEIDAYIKYQEKDVQKEIRTTVALEQQGKSVKVRMINKQAENSGNISNSDLNATENAFFDALNKQLGVKQKK